MTGTRGPGGETQVPGRQLQLPGTPESPLYWLVCECVYVGGGPSRASQALCCTFPSCVAFRLESWSRETSCVICASPFLSLTLSSPQGCCA